MTAGDIPDIVLERYRLNELPPPEQARIAKRIDGDAALRERLAALDRSDEELALRVAHMRSRLGAREMDLPANRLRSLAWPIPAAAAICTVLIAGVVWQTRAPQSDADTDRIKGGVASGQPALAVYRRTNEGSEQLADGSVAHAGDVIRVGYRAAGHAYGLILSIDGRGEVTMHLPPSGTRAVVLKPDPTVLLDQAYELDDAPRWERFYFVAADTAFDATLVMQAARAAAGQHSQQPPAGLELPRGLDQTGFTLQKESRR